MKARDRVLANVDALAGEIEAVSRAIHASPELGYHELKAAALLTTRLAAHDFVVETPIRSMPTAIRASVTGRRRQSPAVGFIGEYDALPDIGHGCGHNLIAASAFGAAAALAPLARQLGGSVWFFGTPAEESDGAKIPMLARGVFDPADVLLEMHPEGMYLLNTVALALDAFEFRFRGKAAHAAATPEQGVNALDAVILLFNAINAMRQQLPSTIRIHGIITQGGAYPNIIPDLATARFYVRAPERGALDDASRKVKSCARGAAKATGCKLEVRRFEASFDHLTNNPVLSQALARSLSSLGVTVMDTPDPVPGSSDIGNVSQQVPSVYFYCATAPAGSILHTEEFARLSILKQAHDNALIAAKAMALTGLEILQSRQLLKAIVQAGPKRRSRRLRH
jgi:amidohydrolase